MKTSETKVGALTLGGAVILAGMISFLGAFKLFDGGYDLNVAYPSVNGLQVGSAVRYAGVPIGSVKAARVEPDQVVLTVHVNKGVQIPQEADFSIGSDGVMGEKFVDIRPPKKYSGVYVKPGSSLTGQSSSDINDFMANSAKVLEKVEGIADALNNVFGDKEVQKSMRDGFVNIREISNNLNKFTKVMAESAKENQAEIKNMIAQLNQMSVRMNASMAHVESLMKGVDANGQTGRNVAIMAKNLAVTSKNLEDISQTLADVARDPQTKEDLKATIHTARGVTEGDLVFAVHAVSRRIRGQYAFSHDLRLVQRLGVNVHSDACRKRQAQGGDEQGYEQLFHGSPPFRSGFVPAVRFIFSSYHSRPCRSSQRREGAASMFSSV